MVICHKDDHFFCLLFHNFILTFTSGPQLNSCCYNIHFAHSINNHFAVGMQLSVACNKLCTFFESNTPLSGCENSSFKSGYMLFLYYKGLLRIHPFKSTAVLLFSIILPNVTKVTLLPQIGS